MLGCEKKNEGGRGEEIVAGKKEGKKRNKKERRKDTAGHQTEKKNGRGLIGQTKQNEEKEKNVDWAR